MVKIELTIWGNRDYPLILDAIRASDVDCRPAPRWTKIEPTVGGAIPERVVTIDLDSGHHDAVPEKDPSTDTAFRFPLQVSRSSLEFFSVRVKTATSHCTFRLEIVFRDNEQQKIYTIADSGSAFRVASPRAATARMEWRSTQDGLWAPTRV